eukprot:s3739_g4.t1
MGFKNSVALAQHVHRFIVQKALAEQVGQGAEAELRKDKPFPVSNPMHRIYLDNFDQLCKVSAEDAKAIQGQVSPLVQALRDQYQALGVPRHPKKAVSCRTIAEVQGAIVDGHLGMAYPKVEKVLKYAHLSRLLLEAGEATQKQMQIVGGGLVYISMFRRPLLGCLNHVWQFILQCEGYPPFVKFPLPDPVKQELVRFLGLLPLAYMDFRTSISPQLTASDASQSGGGVTVSTGLTPAGAVARHCSVRGDLVDPVDIPSVLTIGLFDGIGALRVAADALGWNVVGHISVEKYAPGQRVVESRFPNSILVPGVEDVDYTMVREWAQQFSQVSVVMLGAGPPCQGVSGLNAARKGALKDARSSLFSHVARIRDLLKRAFPWAQVRSLMESVASMDKADQDVMTASFGVEPWHIDAHGVSLAHRPRLYWIEWELLAAPGVQFGETPLGQASVQLEAQIDPQDFLEPGWKQQSDTRLPTFTTSRPRASPGYKPAGLQNCTEAEQKMWKEDEYRFPPYQYQGKYLLRNRQGKTRLVNVQEREVIMGFPKDYTSNCMPKKDQGTTACTDVRLSLIGNSWNVTVVAWLMSQLGSLLGLNPPMSVGDVVKRTSPGCTADLQTYLGRPSMRTSRRGGGTSGQMELVKKLMTLVSIKGEDILVQSSTEDQVRYHRLRASIPAKLWRWKAVASWRWTGEGEHINSLEMRAVLTALRWRLERHKALWADGKGRSCGSNILASLQDAQPHLKGKLKMSWRLMKTWVTHEIPNRAPPLPIDALHLMVGYSLFKEQAVFALSLLVGFHALLRTGELVSLKARHVSIARAKGPAVLSLGLTKSGKRQGAAESVTINAEDVCRRLFQWKKAVSPEALLTGPAHSWRKQFSDTIRATRLDTFDFRPYSLRRGGATYYFQLHGRFDSLLVLGVLGLAGPWGGPKYLGRG